MLSFPTPSVYQSPKCFVTYGTMPHIEPKQLPTKGKPWAPILGQGFNYKVGILLQSSKRRRAKQREWKIRFKTFN